MKFSVLIRSLPALAILLFLPQISRAQFVTGAAASAMGGAGRSAVDAQEIGFLNPAALAHLQGVHFSGFYQNGSIRPQQNWKRYGFLLSDASPDILLPGALAFVRGDVDLGAGQSSSQQDLQASFGGFVLPSLSLGASVHRLTDETSSGNYAQLNMHLGLLYSPVSWLGLAVTAHDFMKDGLVKSDSEIPAALRLSPVYGFGALVVPHKIMRVRLDLEKLEREGLNQVTDVMLGVESWFLESLAFRIGGKWQETSNQMYLTGGFGYLGPKLRADYSLQKEQRGSGVTRHMIDLWLPF